MKQLTEREEHFISILGHGLEGARLAGLHVSLELPGGHQVEGVPRSSPIGHHGQGIGHTGVSRYVEIDGELTMLKNVRSYRIIRPDETHSDVGDQGTR